MQKITVLTVDDMLKDGTEADRTIRFVINGRKRVIDLTEANAAMFEAVMAPYLKASRPAKPRSRKRSVQKPGNASESRQIRLWGRENGFTVSSRGRLPQTLTEAYSAREKVPA